MRWLSQFALVLLAGLAFGQQDTPAPSPSPSPLVCSGAFSPSCSVSAQDQKSARKIFESAEKLKREGRGEEALERFNQATQLVPRNMEYVDAREKMRLQLVLERIRTGNEELAAGNDVVAMAAFRSALELDPENASAAEHLREAARLTYQPQPASQPLLQSAGLPQPIELKPDLGVHDFHLRTDTRSLFSQIAQAYGIKAQVDDQIRPRPVRFDLNNADFALAIETAQLMANAFWVPVSEHEILVQPDTPQARQQYQRMALETFYFSEVSTPQELNEMTNMLRGVLEARLLTINTRSNSVTLRAPLSVLREAEQLINSMQEGRPQVLIDVRVYQLSHTMMSDLGVALPLQFQIFNLSNLQQVLASGNLASLLAAGALNGQSLQAILAQLASQNPELSKLLANPIATFGGGETLFGVGIPPATLHLSLNSSKVKELDHLTLQVAHGTDATFHFGERFPVLTASYSAVYSLPGLSQLATGSQNLAAFPAVNYQDLGLNVKATPTIHGDSVTLKLDTQIQALGASSVNGIPVLDNRQYQGTISLKDGQTAVVAGTISEQDVRNIQGIPGLSGVPGVGYGVSEHNTQITDDELLIMITPHITNRSERQGQTIVMTQ